jgi:hypothetical protein
MKLLSHTEFSVRNGVIYYMERPLQTDKVNAKQGLTLSSGPRKVRLPEGIYTVDQLKSKMP